MFLERAHPTFLTKLVVLVFYEPVHGKEGCQVCRVGADQDQREEPPDAP